MIGPASAGSVSFVDWPFPGIVLVVGAGSGGEKKIRGSKQSEGKGGKKTEKEKK